MQARVLQQHKWKELPHGSPNETFSIACSKNQASKKICLHVQQRALQNPHLQTSHVALYLQGPCHAFLSSICDVAP
jgi:hypothetical protein